MHKGLRSALCLGHPGHEIRVLAWAAQHKPLVSIFTDGSGPDRPSRLESTRKTLDEMGCTSSFLFGSFPDREIYSLMRKGPDPFINIARNLEQEWTRHQVEMVAGDALEGFNTTHDVCRMIINAVVEKCARKNHPIKNYEFPLESLAMPSKDAVSLVVQLDDGMFQWKKEVVNSAYPELAGEVDRIIGKHGETPFRTEILNPAVAGRKGMFWNRPEAPFYETYGSRQIEKGHYVELITYHKHLLPIAEGLWQWAISD